jgi:subtilisin family serine protease
MRVKPKSSGWRHSGRAALACAIALSASSFAMAKPTASYDTFVSKEVEYALQALEGAKTAGKSSADRVRVIVSFATACGRAPEPSAAEVSSARSAVLSSLPAGSYETVASFSHIPAATLEIDRNALQALKSHPLVFAVNEDMEVFQQMPQSNILTGATTIHGTGVTGEGVNVAIIDSGVQLDHPALMDDMLGHGCFRTENDCPGGTGADQGGHGTHVAGIITGNNGAAPDAQFYALKVFTTGSTSTTNILNALNFVIAENNAPGGLHFDFVNMSLGGGLFTSQAACDSASAGYVSAFATLNSQGTVVFVATGNEANIDRIASPGCATGAVGVGSSGDSNFGTLSFSNCTDVGAPDKVSCFSNAHPEQGVGRMLDLYAPGCLIQSTGLNGSVTTNNCGTSMATPYAAGIAALVKQVLNAKGQSMTAAQMEDHLRTTGTPITDYRSGALPAVPRVNATNAVGALALDPPSNFQITGTTSTSVSMEWDPVPGAVSYSIYVEAAGNPPLQVGSVDDPTVTFTDANALCGPLTYFVQAFDGDFESLPSNTDSDTARDCPFAPTDLSLTVIDADSIQLDWTDNATDETGYVIQRRLGAGDFADIGLIGADLEEFVDDDLSCGFLRYRVAAVRGSDRSLYSNEVEHAQCAPANDLFANATVVSANATPTTPQAVYNEPLIPLASESPGDPNYSCKFGGAGPGFHGVWYAITADEPLILTVSTAGSTGAIDDTLIGIYTHNGVSFTQVACNDDISGSNYLSTVSHTLAAGTTYYAFVSQWLALPPDAVGNQRVTFSFAGLPTPPPHDLFANAKVIGTNVYNDTVPHMQLATVTAGDPVHACRFGGAGTGNHNVWYRFTPAESGSVTIDTFGSSGSMTDTILSVFSGEYGAFSQVACNDDFPGSGLLSRVVDVPLSAGTTYTVYISRWSATATSTPGTLQLNFAFVEDTGEPAISVDPSTVSASVLPGQSASPAVTISNTGTGNAVLDWNVVVTPQAGCDLPASVDWLSVSPLSGSVDNGDSADLTVQLNSTGLATGEYTATLCIDSNDAGQPTTSIDVSLEVLPIPVISVSESALTFTIPYGGASSSSIEIANQGDATLSWQVEGEDTTEPLAATAHDARVSPAVTQRSPARVVPLGANVLEEGFESGQVPPPGWSRVSTNASFSWKLKTVGPPQAGSSAADVEYDPALSPQDEWLLSPEMNLSSGMLTFWSNGSLFWCRNDNDNCDLEVWLVVGEVGGGDDVFVGTADDDWTATFVWSQSSFDLGPHLPGGPVRIAFRYVGVDGAQVSLDSISLTGSVITACDAPGGIGWISAEPDSGTVMPGLADTVNLSIDSDGLELGDYTGNLCISSNDPFNPLVVVPVELSVVQAEQTIDFAELDDRGIDETPFTVSATASSGLEVSFASLTESVCEVDGDEVSLLSAGECTIEATQDGDANYLAADPVARSFTVGKLEQTIDFPAIGDKVFGDMPFLVAATASSGLEVSIASLTPAVCEVDGFEVSLVDIGDCSLEATQAGDDTYAAADPVQQSFEVIEPPVEIFVDGFESEPAPLKVQLEGEGVKLLSVPAVDRLARSVEGRIAVLAELMIGSERVGLVEARCGAGSCELRVVSFDADKQLVEGNWWPIESEPALFRIRSSDSAVIGVERFSR